MSRENDNRTKQISRSNKKRKNYFLPLEILLCTSYLHFILVLVTVELSVKNSKRKVRSGESELGAKHLEYLLETEHERLRSGIA
ncbi:MAG: hypothetical protein WC464_06330 [Bdellovibrionales bacterium]